MYEDELYHYGIKGMRWGVRKKSTPNYRSTGIRSALARRSNSKVDKSFNEWEEGAKNRDAAIEAGKKANQAKLAWENDRSNADSRAAYRQANKEYKQALNKNTTYRKGVVRQEVGRDISRKYLSEAKKLAKQMTADPTNKQLKKKYTDLMNKHDVERAKARKAVDVGAKRSRKIASIKSGMTKTAKAAVATAAVGAGLHYANKYLLNGNLSVGSQQVVDMAKRVKNLLGYLY